MADAHHGVHVSAGIEISLQLHPNRIASLNQVIEDAIGDLFVGDGAIPVTVHVELDGLQLNDPRPRLIQESQHSEIGVTRERTETGEFRQFDRDLIGTALARILKTDQLCIGNGPFPIKGSAGGLRGGCTHGRETTQRFVKTLKPDMSVASAEQALEIHDFEP